MRKYNNIDGVRCFATLGVLCMHVYANIGFKINDNEVIDYIINNVITQFGIFVRLFFVISGFGMCCGYYDKIKNREISIDQFYNKRYIKILPFFVVLNLLDLVVSLVLNDGLNKYTVMEAFANSTLMFGFFSTEGMSVIGVGWTLGVIFGFYIIFPFFVYLLWTKKRAWFSLCVTMIISVVCLEYFNSGGGLCFTWLCYFVLGGLIFLYKENIDWILKNNVLNLVILIIGFIVVFMFDTSYIDSKIVSVIKPMLGFSLMLIGCLGGENKLLANKFTKYISELSLEIYLAHMLIFRFIEKLGMVDLLGQNSISYVVVCIMTVVGVIIFARVFKYFELFIVNNKRKN